MILSVSRRTDIPAFYAEWFMNRIREGFVMVRNPMNYHQVSKVSLEPEVIDCIVFWTKNAAPMLPYLEEIGSNYPFYFHYTLNAYDLSVEQNLPSLEDRLETFRELSRRIGPDRVIWRYDPVFVSGSIDVSWHAERYRGIAEALDGYTHTCVFSFIDVYDKIKSRISSLGIRACSEQEMNQLAAAFAGIASDHHLTLRTCAEEIDLSAYGIQHGCCIDGQLIEHLTGWTLSAKKTRTSARCVGVWRAWISGSTIHVDTDADTAMRISIQRACRRSRGNTIHYPRFWWDNREREQGNRTEDEKLESNSSGTTDHVLIGNTAKDCFEIVFRANISC